MQFLSKHIVPSDVLQTTRGICAEQQVGAITFSCSNAVSTHTPSFFRQLKNYKLGVFYLGKQSFEHPTHLKPMN